MNFLETESWWLPFRGVARGVWGALEPRSRGWHKLPPQNSSSESMCNPHLEGIWTLAVSRTINWSPVQAASIPPTQIFPPWLLNGSLVPLDAAAHARAECNYFHIGWGWVWQNFQGPRCQMSKVHHCCPDPERPRLPDYLAFFWKPILEDYFFNTACPKLSEAMKAW